MLYISTIVRDNFRFGSEKMFDEANHISTAKEFCAKALGDYVLNYLEPLTPSDILPLAEHSAVALVHEIQAILDNEALDDPTCFRRIDAIVDTFHRHGLSTTRHDF